MERISNICTDHGYRRKSFSFIPIRWDIFCEHDKLQQSVTIKGDKKSFYFILVCMNGLFLLNKQENIFLELD